MTNIRSSHSPTQETRMLTRRQQEIWKFLTDYVDDHGYPPTVREIGEAVGLASPSTVHAHLDNLEDYVAVPEPLSGGGEEFLLRVKGDSMVNAGILEGDLVVVRRQQTAQNGDIVVALAGEDESAAEPARPRKADVSGSGGR